MSTIHDDVYLGFNIQQVDKARQLSSEISQHVLDDLVSTYNA